MGDKLTDELEEANLEDRFSTELGYQVQNYEWLVHFEGRPYKPKAPPLNGGQAHERLMGAIGYVLSGSDDPE